MESALYVGRLRHRRFSPRKHEFAYPVYMAFLDIDRLPGLLSVSPFSSYNRWNWMSYHEHDHFGDPTKSLRDRLCEDAARHRVNLPNGKIFLLTHLRYLGYVFNPVSFFYFYDQAEDLVMTMAEVNNTFGETNNYWLTAENNLSDGASRRYLTAKEMHVSPFHPMDLDYDWIFTAPGKRLIVHMNTLLDGRPNFDATLELDSRPWEAKQLVRTLAAFPLMTIRIIAAIHWQALRLWLKKVPVYAHVAKIEAAPAAREWKRS
jgi:DUF1365 family protein